MLQPNEIIAGMEYGDGRHRYLVVRVRDDAVTYYVMEKGRRASGEITTDARKFAHHCWKI